MKKALLAAAAVCCAAAALLAAERFLPGTAGTEMAEELTAAAEDKRETGNEETEIVEETSAPLTLEDIRDFTFTDVPQTSAAVDCISYVAYQGILPGIDRDCFCPDDWISLAAVLTALHRLSGEPAPAYEDTFSDVSADSWYTDAAAWAYSAGIIAGNGRLDALEPVTRARLAVLLFRFAASEDDRTYDEQLTGYTDGGDVSDDARLAVVWALENHLFSGMVSDTIHPGLPVTRAQLAQVLTALAAYNTEEPIAAALTLQMSAKIAVSVSRSNHDDIQLLVDTAAAKYGATGLQAAVVEKGRVTDWYTYGWAVKDSEVMTPEHKIRAASISKVAVGMAAMLLREKGYIDLDQDISEYWGIRIQNPTHPETPVTVRNLLSHMSTIRSFDGVSCRDSAVRTQLSSPSCFTSGTPGDVTSWSYNNYGFAVLGMTLELASGQYLDTVLEENLWRIMEIDAAFDGGCIRNTDLLTELYYYDKKVGLSIAKQKTFTHGEYPGQTGGAFAGGLTASAKDLAKAAALLANDGYYEGLRLMEAESIELMETRNETQLPDGTYQALPLRSQDGIFGRDRIYYHTGSAYGVYNLFSYDPVAGDGVVVLTVGANGAKDSRGIYAVCSEISGGIYQVLATGEG